MALVLTGKLLNRTSKPYSMKDRETGETITGTSHKARVSVGRGDYIDVKLDPEHFSENGGPVPPVSQIPEDGLDVSWAVSLAFGKVSFLHVVESASPRAVRAS